jgi:hypothetical protein
MNKMLFIFIAFIVFSSDSFSQTPVISYKTITEKDPAKFYFIQAVYPQIDFGEEALMGLRGIASDVNYMFDTVVTNMITCFKNEVSEAVNKTSMNGLVSSLDISANASVISGNILSADIKEFSSVIANAHPVTLIHSYNYSFESGGLLSSISDLFRPGSDYVKYISEYCINELRMNAQKQGYTDIDDMIKSGASADANNFSVWNVNEDSLIITFNPATVYPHVFGIQKVSIPLANMTDMINPKGPLSFMFR